MRKKIKNITTYILGVIAMSMSLFMFYVGKPFKYDITVFIIGLLIFTSYTKFAKTVLKYLPKFKIQK